MRKQKSTADQTQPRVLMAEIVSKVDMPDIRMKIAVAEVPGTGYRYHLTPSRQISLADFNAMIPSKKKPNGYVWGSGTTVQLTVTGPDIQPTVICDIVGQPTVKPDPAHVHHGEVIRVVPIGGLREHDLLYAYDHADGCIYLVNPGNISRSVLTDIRGMIVDPASVAAVNGMALIANKKEWLSGTGTQISFKADFNRMVQEIQIVAQPADHPDDHAELQGKLVTLAKEGTMIEHVPTATYYKLDRKDASAEFWKAARALYGVHNRHEPKNLIPVTFKRSPDRHAFDPQIITL